MNISASLAIINIQAELLLILMFKKFCKSIYNASLTLNYEAVIVDCTAKSHIRTS